MAAKTAAQSIIPIRMAWRAFTTLERKGLVIMGGKCTRLGLWPRRIADTQVRSAVAGVFRRFSLSHSRSVRVRGTSALLG